MKIGSALLTAGGMGLDKYALQDWVNQICALRRAGLDVVLVSSGAIAEGVVRLGWRQRPSQLPRLQAAAAVGQMGLMQAYEDAFRVHGVHAAQLLLTHDDFANRSRYVNVAATIRTLLRMGVIPVINENDTVSTEEVCFGDNDMLAALVGNMIGADHLLILTDQEGLYTRDPRKSSDARLIARAPADAGWLREAAGGGGAWGRGGMASKVRAAGLFALSGGATTIAAGHTRDLMTRVSQGEPIGTRLEPGRCRLQRRGLWLAGCLRAKGTLVVTCQESMLDDIRADLTVGLSAAVRGDFAAGETIEIEDTNGGKLGKGISNYSARDIKRMIADAASPDTPVPVAPKPVISYRNIVPHSILEGLA